MKFDEVPENLKKAEELEYFRPEDARQIYMDIERSTWNYLAENYLEKDSFDFKKAGLYLKKTKKGFERLNSSV